MRRFNALWIGLALLASVAAAAKPEDEIKRLVAAYAAAVDAADPALAAMVWSTTAEVSFIHPGGHERGWEQIKTNVFEKAMGETYSERQLTVRDLVVHPYGDSAWAEFYWHFQARLRQDGSPVTTDGRETQIYRKLGGRWKLVHVHYSEMPKPR